MGNPQKITVRSVGIRSGKAQCRCGARDVFTSTERFASGTVVPSKGCCPPHRKAPTEAKSFGSRNAGRCAVRCGRAFVRRTKGMRVIDDKGNASMQPASRTFSLQMLLDLARLLQADQPRRAGPADVVLAAGAGAVGGIAMATTLPTIAPGPTGLALKKLVEAGAALDACRVEATTAARFQLELAQRHVWAAAARLATPPAPVAQFQWTEVQELLRAAQRAMANPIHQVQRLLAHGPA